MIMWLRTCVAVTVGLLVGGIANMVVILINSKILYPMPVGTSLADPESFGLYVSQLPPLAFIVVWIAHALQTVLGGSVASRIVGSSWKPTTNANHDNDHNSAVLLVCHILGILTLAGCLINNLQIPNQPLWTWLEIPMHPLLAQWTGRYYMESETKAKQK